MSSSYSVAPLALKLVRRFSPKEKRLEGLLARLKGLRGEAHWVFLQTHGMWTAGTEGELTVEIAQSGETTLHIDHRDYKLVKALESVPLFHFAVDKLAVHKQGKDEVSPWGVHIRVKRGELAQPPSESVEVSPLAFLAATAGLHRLARSCRLQAVQSALSKEVAAALLGASASRYKAFLELYGVRDGDEVLGALAALSAGTVKASRMPEEALAAELTTAREPPRNVRAYRCLLEHLLQRRRPEVGVRRVEGGLQLYSKSGEGSSQLNEALQAISREVLGRLETYQRVLEELKGGVRGNELKLAVGFSEQMGPCDLYLIASIVELIGLSGRVEATYVLATPLSYPMAAVSSLYAALELEALGRVELVLASEDVAVSKALAEYLADRAEECTLVYLAAGPTPQVLALSVELKRRLGDRAVLIPLAPKPAAAT
jgi:hypothetical protein